MLLLLACSSRSAEVVPARDSAAADGTTGSPAGDTAGDTARDLQRRLGLCDAWDVPTMEDEAALAAADADADDAVALGLGLVRPHRPNGSVFAWNLVHPSGAEADDWTLPDHVMTVAGERGLDVVGTLVAHADAENASSTATPLTVSDEDLDAWRRWVTRAVERYDGDGVDDMPGLLRPVVAWQMGNESTCAPENLEDCATDFTQLMAATYDAAKRADAATPVLAAGAGPVFDPTGVVQDDVLGVYRWYFEHGGADTTDAFDFHVQVGSPTPPLEDYLALWGEVVGDEPLWIGETGTRSAAGSAEWPDAETEAAWMTTFLDGAYAAGVDRVLWCRGGLETEDVPVEVRDAVRAYASTL